MKFSYGTLYNIEMLNYMYNYLDHKLNFFLDNQLVCKDLWLLFS